MKKPKFKIITYLDTNTKLYNSIWYSVSFFVSKPYGIEDNLGILYKVEGYFSSNIPFDDLPKASCHYMVTLCELLESKYGWPEGKLKIASVSSNPSFRPVWEEGKVSLWINL